MTQILSVNLVWIHILIYVFYHTDHDSETSGPDLSENCRNSDDGGSCSGAYNDKDDDDKD